MISFVTEQPLQESVDALGRKSPLGALLSSAQWGQLPIEIRERAFFSAWLENERLLGEMQRRLIQRVALERDRIEAGGRLMDRGRFIEEMQGLLDAAGYVADPEKEGTLQELASAGRLGLIWQMNLDQAHGHASWKAGMDPDVLDAFPAQELIRDMERMDRRPWPRIWLDANGVFYYERGSNPDYPEAPGRMIALKTDPIWTAISEFGTPWPPFAWGSGMGLRDIGRAEAVRLGLIDEEDEMIPQTVPFTSGLKASVKGLPERGLSRILDRFGDRVRVDGEAGTIEWLSGKEAA